LTTNWYLFIYKISKHLAILKNAGLLQATRKGTWVYYCLDNEASPFLRDLLKVISRHLKQKTFSTDAVKLMKRLTLRQNGQCVVGFASLAELTHKLKQKKRDKRSHGSKTARHLHLHA
jgi:hypothetical protein